MSDKMTTIKLSRAVKRKLDSLGNKGDTYEEIILRLLHRRENVLRLLHRRENGEGKD